MLPSNSPWAGLEVGRVDTRRVDANARWNFFWAVMPQLDVALVLQLERLPDPTPTLPRLSNLEIRFQTLPGGPIFYIRLKDSAQIELFETLCRDVVATAELAATVPDALERAIARTFRWHYLLRGGVGDALSEEAQKGLIGEIEILKRLVDGLGASAALDAWTGPSGAPKDFELARDCIEVKARRLAAQPFVRINNEFQLSDVPERRLWLAVLAIDKVQKPHGLTLCERVAEITRVLEKHAPDAILEWNLHLVDAGFDPEHDYSRWRWTVDDPVFHLVTQAFPRLCAPVPLGVSNVSHALSLDACASFRTPWERVRTHLFAKHEDG